MCIDIRLLITPLSSLSIDVTVSDYSFIIVVLRYTASDYSFIIVVHRYTASDYSFIIVVHRYTASDYSFIIFVHRYTASDYSFIIFVHRYTASDYSFQTFLYSKQIEQSCIYMCVRGIDLVTGPIRFWDLFWQCGIFWFSFNTWPVYLQRRRDYWLSTLAYLELAVVVIVWLLDLQPVHITINVVSSNPVHGEVYSMPHYAIKFVSDLRQVGGFLHVFRFPPKIKLTETI